MNSDSIPNSNTTPGETRRTFIRKAATVAAAVSATGLLKTPVYGQSQAPSAGRVIGANDRINVAYIGTGKQNTLHINLQKKFAQDNNVAQVAVCDVYQRHLDAARKATGVSEAERSSTTGNYWNERTSTPSWLLQPIPGTPKTPSTRWKRASMSSARSR